VVWFAFSNNDFFFDVLQTLQLYNFDNLTSATLEIANDANFPMYHYNDYLEFFAMIDDNPNLLSIKIQIDNKKEVHGSWPLTRLCGPIRHDVTRGGAGYSNWPLLTHLSASCFYSSFWENSDEISRFAALLAGLPLLESLTIVDRDAPLKPRYETIHPLSLAQYPTSLSRLKFLKGTPLLIAGVLSSPAAASSVRRIFMQDRSPRFHDTLAADIERILDGLTAGPALNLHSIDFDMLALDLEACQQLVSAVPGLESLEFHNIGPETQVSQPLGL